MFGKPSFLLSLALGALALFAVGPLPAQSPGAAAANTQAYDLFAAGDYQAALAAYQQLLKDYPTDLLVPVATVQTAYCFFFLGDYDKAEEALKRSLSGPPLPADLRQSVDGFLPQILAARASAMPLDDPKRKAAYEAAIKAFTEYLTKYPQAKDTEAVIQSRALANYQIGNLAEVIKDMEANIQRFGTSSTIASSKNLLAIALATQASRALTQGGDQAAALAEFKRSADLLTQIIDSKQDIALINDANFQLGEILFNQALFVPEADRPALYDRALQAYRAIKSKDEIVALQQEKLQEFPNRRRLAIQQRNDAALKQLNEDNERELRKLAELQGKPDQVATALLKMAEIYFQKQNFNAARTVLSHLQPFLSDADDTKRALYFTTMSYAVQNAADRAPAGYNEFISKHKGDPLGENLPITMGNMFLALNQPTEAVKYFDESLALYPQGRFAGLSAVTKASALTRLNELEQALKTFQDFLAKNPPPEIGVIAQSGLAGIYKDTQKWDDALAAYKVVQEKFPNTPQATEAEYWIGICTQQKGDNAAAIDLLDAFVKANAQHPYAPLALYAKGGAQIALQQVAEGINTLAGLATAYPDSQPAPFTYFMRAQLLGQQGKTEEVIGLMKDFIKNYPKDDKVFFAYETIAQNAVNTGNVAEGITTYREFVDAYPDAPKAPEALYKIADLKRGQAEALGRYSALNDAERSQWKTLLDESIATAEQMIKAYPESPELALALRTLLQNQRLLISADLKKPAEVETYFQSLADTSGSPSAKSKILFALAAYVAEGDKGRAVDLMNQAFDAKVVYSPQDLDFYGLALVDTKKLNEATTVFEKIAADYPIPAGTPANQAPRLTQEAQAIALFGKGRVAQASGKTEEAGKIFEQLKTLYPWSPKVLEGDYGIAEALRAKGEPDKALALLPAIIRANTASADLRANSMLLGGLIMKDKMEAATDPKAKEEALTSAIDYFIKIAQFYGGVPVAAARGLWEGAQLLELQANAATDPKFKTQQLDRAKAAYKQLVTDYANSEFAPKAQERLTALGGQ